MVLRAVGSSETIHAASIVLNQHEMFTFADILGALKHHVLEEVREPAVPLRLEPEADFVIHAHGYNRRCRIRRNDHAQAILERGALNWNLRLRHA